MFSDDDNKLEAAFREPYQQWKAKPTPDNNAAMLQALHPTIEGAIRTHVGTVNPLLMSRARLMALEGLQSYDPTRGRLQTHLYNHLQGLKRVQRQQTSILKVPERVSLDRYALDAATKDLTNRLNRDPTDIELANDTGFSMKRIGKVRTYTPAVAEGTIDRVSGGAGVSGNTTEARTKRNPWADMIYEDLDPYHQKIMEHAFGLNGRRVLPNQEIARKMNRSPGAISQAKLRIQKMLDEEHELGGML